MSQSLRPSKLLRKSAKRILQVLDLSPGGQKKPLVYASDFFLALEKVTNARKEFQLQKFSSLSFSEFTLSESELAVLQAYKELLILDRFDIYDEAYEKSRFLVAQLEESFSFPVPAMRHLLRVFLKGSSRMNNEAAAVEFLNGPVLDLYQPYLAASSLADVHFTNDNEAAASIYREMLSDFATPKTPRDFLRLAHIQSTNGDFHRAKKTLSSCEASLGSKDSGREVLLGHYNLGKLTNDPNTNHYFKTFLKSYQLRPPALSKNNQNLTLENLKFDKQYRDTVSGPLVTVIFPAYNAESTVEFALRSVLDQDYKNLEVLIFDDMSSDSTKEKIEAIISDYEGPKSVKYHRNNRNVGPYIPRNIGMRLAKGDFITFNDADDFSHPQRISTCVEEFRANRSLSVLNCQTLRISREGVAEIQRWNSSIYNHNAGATLFFRKSILSKTGCYENIKYDADFEFSRRIEAFLPQRSVRQIKVPLYYALYSGASLTSTGKGSLTKNRVSPTRLEYKKRMLAQYRATKDLSALRLSVEGPQTIADYSDLELHVSKEDVDSVVFHHLNG